MSNNFLNPQPRFEALKDQYTRPGLLQEGPASAWFHHNKYYLKKLHQERLDDIFAYVTTDRLLDVGCGMGDFCAVARDAGFSVFGTELSDDYAQHTKQTVGMADIFIGRLLDINFSGQKFNVIIVRGQTRIKKMMLYLFNRLGYYFELNSC